MERAEADSSVKRRQDVDRSPLPNSLEEGTSVRKLVRRSHRGRRETDVHCQHRFRE
jgi:hypothetical protein